jgi:hypothetical protein
MAVASSVRSATSAAAVLPSIITILRSMAFSFQKMTTKTEPQNKNICTIVNASLSYIPSLPKNLHPRKGATYPRDRSYLHFEGRIGMK